MQRMVVNVEAASVTSMSHTFDVVTDGYCRAEGFYALNGKYPIRVALRATVLKSDGRPAKVSRLTAEGQDAVVFQT